MNGWLHTTNAYLLSFPPSRGNLSNMNFYLLQHFRNCFDLIAIKAEITEKVGSNIPRMEDGEEGGDGGRSSPRRMRSQMRSRASSWCSGGRGPPPRSPMDTAALSLGLERARSSGCGGRRGWRGRHAQAPPRGWRLETVATTGARRTATAGVRIWLSVGEEKVRESGSTLAYFAK